MAAIEEEVEERREAAMSSQRRPGAGAVGGGRREGAVTSDAQGRWRGRTRSWVGRKPDVDLGTGEARRGGVGSGSRMGSWEASACRRTKQLYCGFDFMLSDGLKCKRARRTRARPIPI